MKTFGLLLVASIVAFAAVWLHAELRDIKMEKRWKVCLKQAREFLDARRRAHELEFPGVPWGYAQNAVATEPGIRVARSKDITHEDFMDAIDRIEPAATPYLSYARTEKKLIAVDRTWNVDSLPGVKGARGRADNEDAPASGSADSQDITTNMRKVGNVAQGFSRTYRNGWIMDVPKIAGVANVDSYAEATYTEMLKLDMEAAFTSFDQVAVYDAGVGLGAVAAGYRKLTDNANAYAAASAYAIGKPSDLHYAPTAATVTGAMTAVHNRALWKTIALALRTAAKQNGDWMLVCGLTLRQAITDLTIPSQVTVTGTTATNPSQTSDQVRVLTRAESDNVLGGTVDIIQTDFGRFMVATSDYIGTTTTDSTGGAIATVNSAATGRALASFVYGTKDGIILKKGNCFKAWGKMPYREKLGAGGGGDAYDLKALATHGLDNPIKAGWLLLT